MISAGSGGHRLEVRNSPRRGGRPGSLLGLRVSVLRKRGPYGIRTRAAAVRGRCPRPLDEWAVANAECSGRVPRDSLGQRLRGERSAGRGGRRRQRRVGVATVDPLLEAPPDLLARREEVVARAAGRKLDDADRLVAVAVAARIGGCLVERPQAVGLPPEGHGRSTTSDRARREPGRQPGSRSLRTFHAVSSVPRLARPGAPVAARAHEVAVRRLCLYQRGLAVTEKPALVRSHLEEPEVLAVLGVDAVAGLAAGDPERLAAVGAKDVADRLLR